jgi:hypothetical protein
MSATRKPNKSFFSALTTVETTVNSGSVKNSILRFYSNKLNPTPPATKNNGRELTTTKIGFSCFR